jgi:hypothetical protein
MAWTDPRTWVAGETVTAAQLNTHVRDNLKAVGDPWAAYTPTWTAVTTNPTLGNGILAGDFMQAGKLVAFRIDLTFGSTTNAGSGNYRWSLPVTSIIGSPLPVGQGSTQIANVRTWGARLFAVGSVILTDSAGVEVSHNNPGVWANGSRILITGMYEAA